METIDLTTRVGLAEYLELMVEDGRASGRKPTSKKRTRRKVPSPRPDGWVTRVQHVVVEIRPFGKARPNFDSRKKGKRGYMNSKYENSRDTLRLLFGPVLVTMPIIINVVAVRKMPKSWSRVKKDRLFNRVCMTTPDVDNITGAIMDTLVKDEDSGVVADTSVKLWGYADELHITLTEWDETAVWEW